MIKILQIITVVFRTADEMRNNRKLYKYLPI